MKKLKELLFISVLALIVAIMPMSIAATELDDKCDATGSYAVDLFPLLSINWFIDDLLSGMTDLQLGFNADEPYIGKRQIAQDVDTKEKKI